MVDNLLYTVILVSALGCGLIAGVFFAFSSFVMKALSRIPAAQGIAAMQSINVVVLNPVFLGVFFGAAAGCLGWQSQPWLRGTGQAPPTCLAAACCIWWARCW